MRLTLFWPTDISDENSKKMKNLTAEERKFITQNPALLEFILNQKRENADPGNCCEEPEMKTDCDPSCEPGCETSCEPGCDSFSRKRCLDEDDQSSTAPVTPVKLPKLSETDSGLNSINSSSPKEEPKPLGLTGLVPGRSGSPGQTVQQDQSIEESAEIQKSPKSSEADDVDPNEEVKSEDAAEIIENANPEGLQNQTSPQSGFPGLPGLGQLNQMRPHVRNFLQQSAAINSAAASNTPNLFAGLQNQILQAAIQRQKLEEEQKRMIHPAFRQPIPNPLSAHLFPFGHVSKNVILTVAPYFGHFFRESIFAIF